MMEPDTPKRHAAGTNPALRQRILDGAATVFMERGFDAAGVNDICRASGVSKSTLYVYFAHKEELFEALVDQKRDLKFGAVEQALLADGPAEVVLGEFLRRMVQVVCSPEVIRVQRTIIGIAERMPELGARFYAGGAERAQKLLRGYLMGQVVAGRFVISDPGHAAYQLIELASAGLLRQCLYGLRTQTPEEAELDATITSALAMFEAAYGAKPLTRAPSVG